MANLINIIKFICVVFSVILILIGFIIGYYYNSSDENIHPLINGIRDINGINNANFTCSCISNDKRTISFTFDENKINEAYFWD